MSEFKDLYRGHVIFPVASCGPNLQGPFMAGYSVWRAEANNNYTGVLQGSCDAITFPTQEAAFAVANAAARAAVDKLLDG